MCNILKLSGLLSAKGDLLSFSVPGGQRTLFGCSLLVGISTQANTLKSHSDYWNEYSHRWSYTKWWSYFLLTGYLKTTGLVEEGKICLSAMPQELLPMPMQRNVLNIC